MASKGPVEVSVGREVRSVVELPLPAEVDWTCEAE